MTVVDSGVLYACFDDSDRWHSRSRSFVRSATTALIVPATILGEVSYLIEERLPAAGGRQLAEWLAHPLFSVEGLQPQDLRRMTLLLGKYPSMGFVDASLVAVAERLLVDTIATTDRRHFESVQPSHLRRFTLVP